MRFSGIFSKRLGIFQPNVLRLLYVPIYVRLQIFIQLSPTISTRLPEILDCSFGWELRTPNFGEGEAVEGRGWYRSKEL